MTKRSHVRPIRVGIIVLTSTAAVLGLTFGAAFASRPQASSALPCNAGGRGCIGIGFTDAWFGGQTVQFGYSHTFFCSQPPTSGARSGCEAGEAAATPPPSGPVVSSVYVLYPMGFTPPGATVQCGLRCIDNPNTLDLSRLGMSSNTTFSARSFVIEDQESFQSAWWPIVLVGVKNQHAWNTIATAKTIDSVDACQANGGCAQEAETNAFVFFQVLGPGMSPQGPA